MSGSPRFWWRPERGATATVLSPVSWIYGRVAGWKMGRAPRLRASVPVICVGNFVVGGAGKTPTCLALARLARGRGLKPGFLTRGYGGSARGTLIADPAKHTAADIGDEPMLLAAAAPTVVSADRAAGAALLAAQGIDLIIMDDGFQNPSLAKDLSLLCVDAGVGVGNGMVTPSGPLRAPLPLQLRRADAIVLIGEGAPSAPLVRMAARSGKPVIPAALRPVRLREFRKEPLLAFAGIGRPAKFFASLEEAGAVVKRSISFPDHHRFTEADATGLLTAAATEGLRLVTTEKDLVRLAGATGRLAELRDKSMAFAVTLEFENAAAMGEMIEEAVLGVRRHG